MKHLVLIVIFLSSFLCCGCSGGGETGFVSGPGPTSGERGVDSPATPGDEVLGVESITVRAVTSTLPRSLPSQTRYVGGTGRVSGEVVYQQTLPFTVQTDFQGVPSDVDEFVLEFVVGRRVFGLHRESIDSSRLQGGIYTITDPVWSDVPLVAGAVENLAVARINSLTTADANTLWLAGNRGTLLKSTDGGRTFEFQIVGTENDLEDVDFLDALNGWVVAGDDKLYSTTDGGASWDAKTVSDPASPVDNGLTRVLYLGDGTGVVGGIQKQFESDLVYATRNSGADWKLSRLLGRVRYELGDVVGTGPVVWGVIDRGPWVYRSNDNGLTWEETLPDALMYEGASSIAFENDNVHGYFLSSRAIFHTDDGAATFEQGTAPVSSGLRKVTVVSSGIAVAVGDGIILRTVDGGANWTEATGEFPDRPFVDVQFADANTGFAVTARGILMRSQDAGASWTEVYDPTVDLTTDLLDVEVVDANFAALLGVEGLLLRTYDAGQTFETSTLADGKGMLCLDFATGNLGFAAGLDGEIWRTTDGGDSWEMVSTGATYGKLTLRDITTADGRHVVAVGDSPGGGQPGTVVRSTDGGRIWRVSQSGLADGSLFGVSFADRDNGITVGERGQIATTVDGGATWILRTSGTSGVLRSVFFHPNGALAAAVGDDGTILVSIDGGVNWTARASGTANDLTSVFFSSELSGIATGFDGTILETKDGGVTWESISVSSPYNLQSCSLYLDGSGFIVGERGTIVAFRPEANDIPPFVGPPASSNAGLVLTAGPSDADVLSVLSPVTVEVAGDPAVREVTVGLELVNGLDQATLVGTLTRETFQGEVTFDDLVVDKKGTYRLTFDSPGLPLLSSDPFEIGDSTFGCLVGITGDTRADGRAFTYLNVAQASADDPPDTTFASSDFNYMRSVAAGASKNILFVFSPAVRQTISLYNLDTNASTPKFDEISEGPIRDMSYDPEQDRLFVVRFTLIIMRDEASEDGPRRQISGADPFTEKGFTSCRYVPEDDRLFVSDASGVIYVIDGITTPGLSLLDYSYREIRSPLFATPDLDDDPPLPNMDYDRQTDSLYFTQPGSGQISVIAQASTADGPAVVSRTIDIGPTLTQALLDPLREIMYVSRYDDGLIEVYEGYRSLSGSNMPNRVINQKMKDGVLIRRPY